jgi:hypothetical protein
MLRYTYSACLVAYLPIIETIANVMCLFWDEWSTWALFLLNYGECMLYSQGVSFIVTPSTAALSHRNSTSAWIACNSCTVQNSDKRNTLYYYV